MSPLDPSFMSVSLSMSALAPKLRRVPCLPCMPCLQIWHRLSGKWLLRHSLLIPDLLNGACRYHKECEEITETIALPALGHESIFENAVPIVAKTKEFFA